MRLLGLPWDDWLGIAIPLLALVPFAIALRAYSRRPTTRVLLFTAAFGLLFVKGLVIAAEVLLWENHPILDGTELAIEAAVLLLFFAGMVKG